MGGGVVSWPLITLGWFFSSDRVFSLIKSRSIPEKKAHLEDYHAQHGRKLIIHWESDKINMLDCFKWSVSMNFTDFTSFKKIKIYFLLIFLSLVLGRAPAI